MIHGDYLTCNMLLHSDVCALELHSTDVILVTALDCAWQGVTRIAAVMAIALTAVICVGVFSRHMGATSLEATKLRADSNFDVADAILKSAGVKDKEGSIPASIAALAAQAAKEKETGRLTATVELPQIPKKIAAMAAEAKREIMIERSVDRKKKQQKEARKLAEEKKEKAEKEEKEEAAAAKHAKAVKKHAAAEKTKATGKGTERELERGGGGTEGSGNDVWEWWTMKN